MMRPNSMLPNPCRSLGLLALGLALSLGMPTTTRAALMRYTFTATLDNGATLGTTDVAQGLFTAWADVDSMSASTSALSAKISSLNFSIVKNSTTYQGALANFNGINSNASTPQVRFTNPIDFQGLGVGGTGAYFDLTQTTAYSSTNTTIFSSPMVTSLGVLTLTNGFVGNTGTMTRAAVPEPSQVAMGVLAAGYALITAARRYRARNSWAA